MIAPRLPDVPAQSSGGGLSLRAAWLAGATGALALYAATVAPDVLMMDSGEYQWQTWLFPEIVLPQGLPNLVRVHFNYLVLAKLFGLLVPLGNWAFRINLFSCVAASIAVGNACALTYALTRCRLATALTFAALALGQTFWEYAVIAEVLSLQAAMVSAELLLLYKWGQTRRPGWLVALWALNGMGSAAHVQNGLGAPVYLVLTLGALWQGRLNWRQTALCAGVWLAGFTPYLLYVLHEIGTGEGFASGLTSATVGEYGARMLQFKPKVLLRGLLSIGLNYPTGLALLCIPGLVQAVRRPLPRPFVWGWLAVIGVNLVFVMTYDVPDQHSFFVPVYAAAAPLIGLGAVSLLKSRSRWTIAFVLALLAVPVYAALPAIVRQPAVAKLLPLPAVSQIPYRDPREFYLVPWKTGRYNERRYVEEVFKALPPDAVFYCCSTAYDGIRTVQLTESRRQDVLLNPPAASLVDLIVRTDSNGVRWARPVFAWAPADQAVPQALTDYCRAEPRGIVWEMRLPEKPEPLTARLREEAGGDAK